MKAVNAKLRRGLFKQLTLFSSLVLVLNMSLAGVFLNLESVYATTTTINTCLGGNSNSCSGVGSIDAECQSFGFDFGIAKWQCNSPWSLDEEITPGTSVSGSCSSANWDAGSSGADGIVVKAGDTVHYSKQGTSGTVSQSQPSISHITFCGNEAVPIFCGNKIKEAGEQCDDGNLDNGDGCSANCQNECILELTKTDNPDPVSPGDNLYYHLTLQNTGLANCTGTGVRLWDYFDPDTSLVEAMPSPNDGITSEYLKWNFGTMIPGQTEEVDLTMLVSEEVECGTELVNKTYFWSNQTGNGAPVFATTTVICEIGRASCRERV